MLTQGAIITTGKNDVDNVVTEYGIAKLRDQLTFVAKSGLSSCSGL
ncbi:MAG: acetyl-CoA hydrolase/transferase C-terminal domain-containing protein [Oscillibacter sp.]